MSRSLFKRRLGRFRINLDWLSIHKNFNGNIIDVALPTTIEYNKALEVACSIKNSFFKEDDIAKTYKELYYITVNEKMFINNRGQFLWDNKASAVKSYISTVRTTLINSLGLTIPMDNNLLNQLVNDVFSKYEIKTLKIDRDENFKEN